MSDMDNYHIESMDGIHWSRNEVLPNHFPTSNISFTSYPLDTNEKINRLVLMGDNGISSDTTTSAWTLLQDENEWSDLTPPSPTHGCPKLENMSMIRYNGVLYVFGGAGLLFGEQCRHPEAKPSFSSKSHFNRNGIHNDFFNHFVNVNTVNGTSHFKCFASC